MDPGTSRPVRLALHALERLCHQSNSANPRYRLYVEIALEINRHSPTGDHIEIVLTL